MQRAQNALQLMLLMAHWQARRLAAEAVRVAGNKMARAAIGSGAALVGAARHVLPHRKVLGQATILFCSCCARLAVTPPFACVVQESAGLRSDSSDAASKADEVTSPRGPPWRQNKSHKSASRADIQSVSRQGSDEVTDPASSRGAWRTAGLMLCDDHLTDACLRGTPDMCT